MYTAVVAPCCFVCSIAVDSPFRYLSSVVAQLSTYYYDFLRPAPVIDSDIVSICQTSR